MFSNSGYEASSFLVQGESSSLFARVWSLCPSFLVARLTFSCRRTWELSTSKFESESHQFPEGWDNFFFRRHSADWQEIPILWRDILFALTVHHQIVSLAFAIGDPSLEVVSCPRLDMAPISRRTLV